MCIRDRGFPKQVTLTVNDVAYLLLKAMDDIKSALEQVPECAVSKGFRFDAGAFLLLSLIHI